jgi:peptidoglycan-N-acetylglucosamine deacetylase
MKLCLIGIVSLLLILSGCRSLDIRADRAPVNKCQDDLKVIPEMAALLRTRDRRPAEEVDKPLAGLQVALTINGMIRSQGNFDDEIDNSCESENSRENFDKLLNVIKQNNLPPTVDFVVGKRTDPVHLELWLQSGNLVGNMTYSRVKARRRNAQDFAGDIARNDETLLALWKKFPPKQKYFRYPGLKLSKNEQERDEIKAFLKQKGYVDAPATIDSRDKKFSELYCAAQSRGDHACVNLIKAQFKSLLLDTTLRARAAARNRTGYDVKHILIVGANQFTCDNLGELIAYYRSLGAQFISLDEALTDPLYSIADEKGRPAARSIMRETRRGQLAGTEW